MIAIALLVGGVVVALGGAYCIVSVFDATRPSRTAINMAIAAGDALDEDADMSHFSEPSKGGAWGERLGILLLLSGATVAGIGWLAYHYNFPLNDARDVEKMFRAADEAVQKIAEAKAAVDDAEEKATKAKEQAAEAKTEVVAVKADAQKAIELAKAPPPPVSAPIAKFDPFTKKLILESTPPDTTWFIQVGFKGGAPAAIGFVPAQLKDYVFKEGVPEMVSWYRQNGGRTEVGTVGTVQLPGAMPKTKD